MNQFIANSFQVPNAVVDELMAQMSANALRCYLIIIRKTTGWGKTSDKISISQFIGYSGAKDNRTIYTALTELANLGLINAIKNNGKMTEFSLIQNTPEPVTKNVPTKNVTDNKICTEPVTKNVGTKNVTSNKKCTEPVTKNVSTTSDKKCTSTKDNIKNNITKKRKVDFDPETVKPRNVSLEVWKNWIDYRSKIGKKLQPQSWTKQAQMLEGQNNPDEIINQSIMNGWQGLFPTQKKAKAITNISASNTPSTQDETSWIDDIERDFF